MFQTFDTHQKMIQIPKESQFVTQVYHKPTTNWCLVLAPILPLLGMCFNEKLDENKEEMILFVKILQQNCIRDVSFCLNELNDLST